MAGSCSSHSCSEGEALGGCAEDLKASTPPPPLDMQTEPLSKSGNPPATFSWATFYDLRSEVASIRAVRNHCRSIIIIRNRKKERRQDLDAKHPASTRRDPMDFRATVGHAPLHVGQSPRFPPGSAELSPSTCAPACLAPAVGLIMGILKVKSEGRG